MVVKFFHQNKKRKILHRNHLDGKNKTGVKASSESVDQICSNNDHRGRKGSQMDVELKKRNK